MSETMGDFAPVDHRLNNGPMRVDKDSRRLGETVEFRNRRVKTRAKSKAARAARKQGRK